MFSINTAKMLSVALLLSSMCHANAQSSGQLIDAGIVASNHELCKAIRWESAARNQLASEFTKLNQWSLQKDNVKSPESLQAAIAQYNAIAAVLINDEINNKVALGLYLSEGNYAFTRASLIRHLKLDSSQVSSLQAELKHIETVLAKELEQELMSTSYIDSTKLRLIVNQLLEKYDFRIKEKAFALMEDNSKSKFKKLTAEAESIKYQNKHAELRRRFLFHAVQKLAANQRFVGKQPIHLPPSLVVIGNLELTAEIIAFTDQQKELLSTLMGELLDGYQETLQLYHDVKTNKQQELSSAYLFFSKSLNTQAKDIDKKALKQLGNQSKRLSQLQYQFNGPIVVINTRMRENKHFRITDEQETAASEIQQRTFKEWFSKNRFSQSADDKLLQQAKRAFFLHQQIYENIFNDDQRKHWDDLAGPRLTEEQFVKMYVQLEKLQRRQPK